MMAATKTTQGPINEIRVCGFIEAKVRADERADQWPLCEVRVANARIFCRNSKIQSTHTNRKYARREMARSCDGTFSPFNIPHGFLEAKKIGCGG